MGVVISKPAINLREKLTELKAQQGYEERQFHFDNLVTNGTFDTDVSGWTASLATLSVVSNKLRITNSGANYGYAWQSLTTEVGKTYVYSLDYTVGTSSTASMRVGTSQGGSQLGNITLSSSGPHSITFTATTTTSYILVLNLSPADGLYTDIDNVSVYEVDPNDSNKVIHTMPKGWKPLHVFEDGALQREGSAYDYTVEYDGFNYIVKETVAPVAPYSTTVIGVRA
jgi:hypothetical protein